MSPRLAVYLFSAVVLMAQATPTRWERSAQQKRALTQDVVWLTHEPLEFLLRRGDHYDDEPARYARMYDPANLQRMVDAGDRYGRQHQSRVKSVMYLSPDADDPQPVEFHEADGRVSFTVPATRIYGLVVIAQE